MKQTILIIFITIISGYSSGFASEEYQGQLSDKRLQAMGISASGSSITKKVKLQQDSMYSYDEEYENLLKSLDTSNNSDYKVDSAKLDAELAHYEDDYDDLLTQASTILGEDKVSSLTKMVDGTISDKDKSEKNEAAALVYRGVTVNDNKSKIKHTIHIKNANEIIKDSFLIKNHAAESDAKSYTQNDDVDDFYQNLLDELSDGSGDKVDQLFNVASEEELDSEEEHTYKLDDGYQLQGITTVGFFTGEKKRFKKCLLMKTYGGGTWRTYCQPIAKPTQCTDQEWQDLSTMPIMFC